MKHIFLVEDDLSLIGGLPFAVRKQGYEMDIARTSPEADAMWTEGKCDLVILIFVFLAALAAVYVPSKRIRDMVVTETINEL